MKITVSSNSFVLPFLYKEREREREREREKQIQSLDSGHNIMFSLSLSLFLFARKILLFFSHVLQESQILVIVLIKL